MAKQRSTQQLADVDDIEDYYECDYDDDDPEPMDKRAAVLYAERHFGDKADKLVLAMGPMWVADVFLTVTYNIISRSHGCAEAARYISDRGKELFERDGDLQPGEWRPARRPRGRRRR
jgi:hypothetical protein